MKSNVKVHEVNEAPAIGRPEMQQGIRTREAAENWAIKNGYTVVYFFKKHERVYADKTSRQPLAIPQGDAISDQPLMAASEQGQGLIELLFWVALVLFVLIYLCPDSWKW